MNNKASKVIKARKQRKLEYFLQKTLFGRLLSKLIRKFKQFQFERKINIRSNVHLFSKLVKTGKGLFALLIIFLLIVITFFSGYLYFTLKINTYQDQVFSKKNYDDSHPNILLIEFENVDGRYNFVENVGVLSVDTKSSISSLITIDPSFIISLPDGEFTIKSAYNIQNINAEKLDQIRLGIEDLLGVRIDKYIAFDKTDLETIIKEKNIKSVTSEGKKISESELINYLSNEDESEETLRYGNFISYNLENNSNYLSYLKYFFNYSYYTNKIQTNLSRTEFFKLANDLLKIEYPVKIANINSNLGFIDDGFEKGLRGDIILIDEDVKSVLTNFQILSEQVEIEVYNGSNIAGDAGRVSRKIENTGGNVVKYGNYNDTVSENELYVVDGDIEEMTNTLDELRRILGSELELKTEKLEGNFSGNIVIILGEQE